MSRFKRARREDQDDASVNSEMVMLPLPDDLDNQDVGGIVMETGFEQDSVGSPSIGDTPEAPEASEPAEPSLSHPSSSSVGVLDSSDLKTSDQ